MWILAGLIIVFCILLFILFPMISSKNNNTLPPGIKGILVFFGSNIFSIIFIVLTIFGILIVINYYHWNLNSKTDKHIQNIIDVEGFKNPFADGFCKQYQGDLIALDNECQQLTLDNCLNTKCCGVLNKTKCIAGWPEGPAFHESNYKMKMKHDPIMKQLTGWEHKDKLRT